MTSQATHQPELLSPTVTEPFDHHQWPASRVRDAQRKILLIEDDGDLASALRNLFRRQSCDVQWAGNGVEGLDLATKSDPDLVLLDLGLPAMHGFKVLHELSRTRPEIPILVMTGSTDPYVLQRINWFVDGLFHKPVDFDSIMDQVLRLT